MKSGHRAYSKHSLTVAVRVVTTPLHFNILLSFLSIFLYLTN